MLCPNCKSELRDGVRFCRYCGTKFGTVPGSSAPNNASATQSATSPQTNKQPTSNGSPTNGSSYEPADDPNIEQDSSVQESISPEAQALLEKAPDFNSFVNLVYADNGGARFAKGLKNWTFPIALFALILGNGNLISPILNIFTGSFPNLSLVLSVVKVVLLIGLTQTALDKILRLIEIKAFASFMKNNKIDRKVLDEAYSEPLIESATNISTKDTLSTLKVAFQYETAISGIAYNRDASFSKIFVWNIILSILGIFTCALFFNHAILEFPNFADIIFSWRTLLLLLTMIPQWVLSAKIRKKTATDSTEKTATINMDVVEITCTSDSQLVNKSFNSLPNAQPNDTAQDSNSDKSQPADGGPAKYNVFLVKFGSQKLNVIAAVREIKHLGLGEAKRIVESCPIMLVEGITKQEAVEIKTKLEQAGATVEIRT